MSRKPTKIPAGQDIHSPYAQCPILVLVFDINLLAFVQFAQVINQPSRKGLHHTHVSDVQNNGNKFWFVYVRCVYVLIYFNKLVLRCQAHSTTEKFAIVGGYTLYICTKSLRIWL